jgi:cysteine desulfurase
MPKRAVYLDHAAATPLDSGVMKSMQPYFQDLFYNPSATYLYSISVKKDLDDARQKVAYWLGARPSEVIFTAGGSEANNLALHGLLSQFDDSNIIYSSIEHESVIAPSLNYSNKSVKVQKDGRLNLEDLEKKIDSKTVLISVMYANNEIGTVEPIKEVSKLIGAERKRRGLKGLPIYLHTDACQAGNYLDLHVERLGVDLMSLNGGKLYGPKQSGALYVRAGINLTPLIYGGGQEQGLRSGTENVAGVIGFSEALDKAQKMRHDESKRLATLQSNFIKKLNSVFITAHINGSTKYRLPNNMHATFPEVDNERLIMQLDELGIQAAAGSACSASNEDPSHVLMALGKTEAEARSSLRLSTGRNTSQDDIEYLLSSLKKILSN